MDKDTRSQSSCDTEKSLPVCHKRRQSSVSISNSSNSSPVKTQNHSTHHTRKRRRVSNDSRKDNDDDILKLDPIENCLSPYSNGSVSGQSQNSFGHNNSQNNSFGSNNHKNHNSFNNNNNNSKDNFNKNYNNNNNYKNNNNNFNNYNNKNNNNRLNNNQNWYQKNQRYNNGNNNNTNRPFINYQQRINDLQDRLDQKEIQLKESKIDIMNRESDITELKIKHERELLEMEKNHCRKIKEMQLKEIEIIQSHKDDAIKMRLALDNKRDIIAKLRKDLEEAQKDSLVARAILETTNNRNVELTGRIAELLDIKKKNVSNKKIQTDFRGVNVEVQVDGLESKISQMSPPQSTVVNSTTRNDHQFNLSANLSDPKLNRNDSSDSGVSFARSESLASVESAHDPLDTTKSHHLLPNSCQKDILRKLIYKKSPKNPTNHLTINIDGTKSDDYVMVDYIESPDELPGKSLMDIREDLKEVSRDGFGGSGGVSVASEFEVRSGKVQDDFGSLEMDSNRSKGSENDSRIEQRLKFGNNLEEARKKLTVSSLLNLSQNSLNSIKKSKTDLLRSPDILKDFRDILESSPEPSKEPLKLNQNKSTGQSSNSHKNTKNLKFSLDTSSESSQSSTTFESSSRNFEESTRNLLKKFNILHDSLDSDKPPDIFKSPQKTYEMSPKIHNIPPTYRDSPRSSCDLSGSADNLSINSELQDFLNLSESEPTEEPQNTVPISEADFYEFAQKFKEKLKQNKIQKAARDSLHIPIIPCYVNDIEKSNESAADSDLLNNQNSNNNNEIENVQRSKVSTDDHKTTNYEKTDCSTDNESTNGATILPTVNSIKIEKDTDVSENDTDIDECHNAIVRSLIKRESGNESYDEISSISSHCTIGADDNVFRYEHNLSDKNVDDKNVGDKELRVGGNVGAENVSLICSGDKEGEKGGSEDHCGDGTEVNDGNYAEEAENIEKNSQNSINKDLKELEETIKILEGSSENLAAKEVKNEFLRQAEGNVENNLEEIYKSSELSEDSIRPEILPINDQFCNNSEDSGKDSTIQEKGIENLSVLGQISSNCQSNSCNPLENSIKFGQNLTQPLAIFMNPILNSFQNLAENAQNLDKSSPNYTNSEMLSNYEGNIANSAVNRENSTSNPKHLSTKHENLSSNPKNLTLNHKNITSNYEDFNNNGQNETNLQESQTILTTNYKNSNSSLEGSSNNGRSSTNSSLSLNLTSNYESLPNLELNVANDLNQTSQFVDSGNIGQNTTARSLSSEDLTKVDENTSKHLNLTSNSSEIEKVDQNTEISSNSEDLTKVGKNSSMSSKLPSNFEDFNKFGHDSSKLSNLNLNAQDLGHNSSIFTNLTSKTDNLEKMGQNLSTILNITSKSKNLTGDEQNSPSVSNLTSNLMDSVKIGQNTSISANLTSKSVNFTNVGHNSSNFSNLTSNLVDSVKIGQNLSISENLTSKSVNFSNIGQNSSNFSNLIFMSDNLEQNGQNSPKPLNTASIPQILTSNSQNSTSNSQNSTLNSPTPLHTLPIPFRKKSYSPLSLKIQSHNATQSKIVQKIDENCPSYLHSFQDFLTERTTTVNNTQRKNGKGSNVLNEGLKLMQNSGSNVIIDNTRLLHQDQPRLAQVGLNLTEIDSNLTQFGSNFIQNDQKFQQTCQKFPQTGQKFPQTAQKFPQVDQKSKLQKDKLEQSQKEFQQKQKSIKIMKRRESILVDNYRVKRQKIETRSGSAAAQNDEMSRVVEKSQKFADMKASQSRMYENVGGSSSGVILVENMNLELGTETRSSENLFGFRKKKIAQDEGVKSAEFRVGEGQSDKFEDLSKDSQIGMKFSTIVTNANTFETTKAMNQLNNVVNDHQAAPNDDLLRSSSNQADLESNQENTSKTQVDSSLSTNIVQNNHVQLSKGPFSTSGPQSQSHNPISSVPTPQTPSTSSNHLNSTEITQNSSSETTNNSNIILESSQSMTTPNITQMTNSVAHQVDSDSPQPQNSNEFDFNKITELRRNSPSNSSVSSSISREEFRSITPEYKGSPSSSLNDFGMSLVESFTKKRTSPSKKIIKNSPFKVDSKRPRNLPSEDEMGVCSQIVATTLKKSQQQREMSRSSEERMMQNGSFQGYSRNEQFYGFRNDRVDSGFNRESQNDNNNSNYQGNRFQQRDERNRQDFGQESAPNRQNSMTRDRKPFDRSASLSTQDMSPKSPKYSRSNSYQEPQFKSNPKTPLTVPFRPISKETQHIKNSEPTPSPSPPSDEQTIKRAQNKNDISQLVIAELTVFYELRKFESDNPKELFKSMARAITYHFHDKNPDYVPNKNVIKNYVMEVFYNYGTIRSEKDFLLSEEYSDDF